MSDKELQLRGYVRLNLVDGVGPIISGRLLDVFGSIEDIWAAGPAQWRKVDGLGPKLTEAMAAVSDEDVDREIADAADCGATILCRADDAYPAALRTIFDAPAVLYVRGVLQEADAVAMAVVGSRNCTHYGLEQAERFGQLLARAGFTLVSGGARGIDTGAHRGALAVGGRTIAVMGCGLREAYPPENAELYDRIVAEGRGAVVSELPMRTAVLGGNFPKRNRIISGLSLGVVVIEAARRSGSLITARIADEQGRAVFALPGRVDSPLSRGTNELIREGITLVQDLDDVLDGLGPVGGAMTADEPDAADLPLPDGLSETEAALIAAIGTEEVGLDELVRRTGVATGAAASSMTMLCLRGLVQQKPGNVFARKR